MNKLKINLIIPENWKIEFLDIVELSFSNRSLRRGLAMEDTLGFVVSYANHSSFISY